MKQLRGNTKERKFDAAWDEMSQNYLDFSISFTFHFASLTACKCQEIGIHTVLQLQLLQNTYLIQSKISGTVGPRLILICIHPHARSLA